MICIVSLNWIVRPQSPPLGLNRSTLASSNRISDQYALLRTGIKRKLDFAVLLMLTFLPGSGLRRANSRPPAPGGTLSALAEAGVSRTSEDRSIALRGLDEPSSTLVVERCFARYGIVNAEPWQQAILERSANWPQRLSAYLTKALAVMQAHAGINEELGAPPEDRLAEAIEAGGRSRSRYYDRRIQRLVEGGGNHVRCAKRIIPMLREAGGHLPEDEINEALTSPPLGLNEGQAQAFLEAAKHNGLLAPGDHAALHLAIPSLRGTSWTRGRRRRVNWQADWG